MTQHTLSDLEGLTGQKRRTLQHWGDAGVILAEPDSLHGGRGTHRRFPASEAIIARLVTPVATAGMSLGHLVRLATALREALAPGSTRARLIRRALQRAKAGVGNNFIIVSYRECDFEVRVLEDDEGIASIFNPEAWEGEPPLLALCVDLRPLAGLLNEALS